VDSRELVTRFERRRVGDIPIAERGPLCDRLHAIFCETFGGVDRAQFEALYMGSENLLGLGYTRTGELVGFATVTGDIIEFDGRRTMVLGSPLFFRLGYRGGWRGAAFGVGVALRHKLRHPTDKIVYVTVAATPASYLLNVESMPRVYPSCRAEPPPELVAIACEVMRRRGYQTVPGAHPWLVRAWAQPRRSDWAERSASMRGKPDFEFFQRVAPRWAEGESIIICVMLDLDDMLRGLIRIGRRFVRAT
jgi:hypothetical protein